MRLLNCVKLMILVIVLFTKAFNLRGSTAILLDTPTQHSKRSESVVNNFKSICDYIILLAQSSERCENCIVHVFSKDYFVKRIFGVDGCCYLRFFICWFKWGLSLRV